MNHRGDDNDFNSPQEMLERATFLLCLAAFTAGVLLVLTGAVAHELRLVALGGFLLAAAGLARSWLVRRGRFDDSDTAFQKMGQAETPADALRIAELVRLLQRWEELESKRGSPGFDPWAVQEIRHDIRVMVEADPALDRLFHQGHRPA